MAPRRTRAHSRQTSSSATPVPCRACSPCQHLDGRVSGPAARTRSARSIQVALTCTRDTGLGGHREGHSRLATSSCFGLVMASEHRSRTRRGLESRPLGLEHRAPTYVPALGGSLSARPREAQNCNVVGPHRCLDYLSPTANRIALGALKFWLRVSRTPRTFLAASARPLFPPSYTHSDSHQTAHSWALTCLLYFRERPD